MNDSTISQIRVGEHKVGIIGLETALVQTSNACKDATDDIIAEKLLRILSKKNYISQNAREKYKKAFIREYKQYLGLPVEADGSGRLEIKILGGGCNICDGLQNTVMEVLSDLNLPADVEHITEKDRIRQYQVLDGPALVINQKIVANGNVPLKQEIKSMLEKFVGHNIEKNKTDKQVLLKNIPFSESHILKDLVDYRKGQIVSRTFAQTASVSITLFALDKGEKISTHTAPGDAMLQVLDGQALVTIDGEQMNILSNQTVVMPAEIPHSVEATHRFKMLLTQVKPGRDR